MSEQNKAGSGGKPRAGDTRRKEEAAMMASDSERRERNKPIDAWREAKAKANNDEEHKKNGRR